MGSVRLAPAEAVNDKPQEQYYQKHADKGRPGASFKNGADGVAAAKREG
ncbi:hypothetical protein GCM10027348_30180 [Hymenobacter tenuis]